MLLPLATMFQWVQAKMAVAGYPTLFGLLLACGMGLPLPEDVPLFLAGYFVADGKMSMVPAALCAWLGIIGGDCILYFLGRTFGMNITRVPFIGTHINQDRIKWAHERFEKYGVWVVAIGRIFAGIRGAMVVTAGTIRFTFSHFIIADSLAAIVSGGLFFALGYWGRLHMGSPEQIEKKIEFYKKSVSAGAGGLLVLYLLWLWWKNYQREKRKKAMIQQAHLREAASHHD
jgi:membrane protein DedA with SNARE-associated domain